MEMQKQTQIKQRLFINSIREKNGTEKTAVVSVIQQCTSDFT